MRQCDSHRRRDVRELLRPDTTGIGIGARTIPGVTTLPRHGRDGGADATVFDTRGYRRAA